MKPFYLTGGRLSASGTLWGNLVSSALLSPGDPIGDLTINGNYTEAPGARLEIELAGSTPGTAFDRLLVLGESTLAATLSVSLASNFTPVPNTVFNFLEAGNINGTFSNYEHPEGLSLEYSAAGATLLAGNVSPGGITLPEPLYLETFESAAEGALPPGWSAINHTDPDIPGFNLDDPRSDAYKNWIVISRDRVVSIGNAGRWDAGIRLQVKPGQIVNGTEVVNLVNGKFAYAESDSRMGNQVQYLFSPDYNLTGKQFVYLSYHSIYEQNQDSIGAVEYSIDNGFTWWPVVYM
jgi:hypothetical protein